MPTSLSYERSSTLFCAHSTILKQKEGVLTAAQSMRSRMRCRFPGVPEYWKVACTTYGSRPTLSAKCWTKNECPLAKSVTGRMPINRRLS